MNGITCQQILLNPTLSHASKDTLILFLKDNYYNYYYDDMYLSDHYMHVTIVIIIVNFWALPLGVSAVLSAQYII